MFVYYKYLCKHIQNILTAPAPVPPPAEVQAAPAPRLRHEQRHKRRRFSLPAHQPAAQVHHGGQLERVLRPLISRQPRGSFPH